MFKNISYYFLLILGFFLYAKEEDLPVLSNPQKLKTVKSKKIIWKKDGAKMAVVHPYKPAHLA